MSIKDTPQSGECTSASAPPTVTFFPPKEKSKGTRRQTSWPKMFAMFTNARPPTSDKKNDQAGWSPAVFAGDVRKGETVEIVFALVFDFDSGATTPEQALSVWKGHSACVYTSWSHSPTKPKFRLIVVLSRGVTSTEYASLWNTAAGKIQAAEQEIDVATKDASRLWYLPCRRDDNFRVLIQDGTPLDVDALLAEVHEAPTPVSTTASSTPKPETHDRDEFLQAVKERSRLEDLIQPPNGWDRKKPDDWWCNSPLRAGDSTASFHILLSEQVWYDFGLAEGGDVFEYLQRLWGCGFKEALHRRAKELGIKRKRFEPKAGDGIAIDEHDAGAGGYGSDGQVGNRGRFRCTDLGNAERLIHRHGRDIRYCAPWDKWLIWSGSRWEIDSKMQVAQFAQDTVRSIYLEAHDEADADRRKALSDHAKKSEAHGRKVAMLEHAKSRPGIPIAPEDLDRDPWLLNVANGTLDLRTGILREHRREDLITKIARASYDPTASCPLYDAFLDRVQPDGPVRDLIWRLDGSCLVGVIREHVFPIHHGVGRNGKSVHTNALLHVLGDYARQVPAELLMAKRGGDAHPTERATLFGIRFAAANETEEGRRLNEALVKLLTGGDPITARRMREDFWTFLPTHKIQLSTNHRPIIAETKDAIWKRVLLLPWEVQIPDDEQDPQLSEKLKTEANGILAKLVKHCIEWHEHGLQVPDRVKAATAAYRDDMDTFGDFLEGCCVVDKKASDTAKNLFSMFQAWAEENNEYEVSQTRFGRQLTDRGFVKERCSKTGRTVWRGLRVRTGDDATVATAPSMAVEEHDSPDVMTMIAAAEQSEQFEAKFGITSCEANSIGLTGNSLQTLQTIQPVVASSSGPSLVRSPITDKLFDISTTEGEEAYREHLISMV